MPVKEKCLLRGRASKVMERVPKPSGNLHAKIIGSQAVAHKATIVQGIVHGDNQADAQSVALLSMSPRQAVHSDPAPEASLR